jgi:hypothetical protein
LARIRSLKPEAFTSESLAKVGVSAERTFFGLTTIVDDRGRIADKPAQLNGDLWSMRGGHTATELDDELEQLIKADGLVCRYVGCNGKRYLHLVTWDWHQKIDHPSKVRTPRCPHHPVSVSGKAEECGLHDGLCPTSRETLASPREVSRGVRPGDANLTNPDEAPEGTSATSKDSVGKGTASDQQIPESSRDPRESSRDVETDLGPRTMDRGSVKPSRRGGKQAGTGGQSALPGAPPEAETPDQRANRLAKTYTDRMPLASFPAARGIVRRAIDAKETDEVISAALTSLADRNATLTLNSLHEAIYGKNGSANGRGAPGPERARGWIEAGRVHAEAAEQARKGLTA